MTLMHRNCVDALQFVQSGRYVNPSRSSPLLVNVRRVSADGRNLRLYVDKSHAICVTSICSTDSFVTHVPPTGLPQRQLRGVVHSQEWERLVAFFCMVFFQPEMDAQLYKDALTFSTKAGDRGQQGEFALAVLSLKVTFITTGHSAMFKQSTSSNKQVERKTAPVEKAVHRDPFLLESDSKSGFFNSLLDCVTTSHSTSTYL